MDVEPPELPPGPPAPEQLPAPPPEPLLPTRRSNKKPLYGAALGLVLLVGLGAGYWLTHNNDVQSSSVDDMSAATKHIENQPTPPSNTVKVQGLQLDSDKNYGNKYADGILPVGDGDYSTAAAKVGTPYVCRQYAQNLMSDQGGAMVRGPWFIGTKHYDIHQKPHVQGSVMWQASFSNKISGDTRTIITNDLPDHHTGVFPISAADPAYAYDRNPNRIQGQTFTYTLAASPAYGDPSCIGGQVGVMLTGVALFSAFDAGGRDAGAWEVQDSCQGHPQSDGIYHYHTLSSCIKNVSVKTVIGFALDGFPITGPQVGKNDVLTTSDLDVCHGLTSQIVLDGKNVTMYHYVMTQDFPYSVSCYRGTAIQSPGMTAPKNGHP